MSAVQNTEHHCSSSGRKNAGNVLFFFSNSAKLGIFSGILELHNLLPRSRPPNAYVHNYTKPKILLLLDREATL